MCMSLNGCFVTKNGLNLKKDKKRKLVLEGKVFFNVSVSKFVQFVNEHKERTRRKQEQAESKIIKYEI